MSSKTDNGTSGNPYLHVFGSSFHHHRHRDSSFDAPLYARTPPKRGSPDEWMLLPTPSFGHPFV